MLKTTVTHQNHHRRMELHHVVTMEHTMTSHVLHYDIVMMELVLQLDVFLANNIKDKIHSKILWVLAYHLCPVGSGDPLPPQTQW